MHHSTIFLSKFRKQLHQIKFSYYLLFFSSFTLTLLKVLSIFFNFEANENQALVPSPDYFPVASVVTMFNLD